MLADYDRLSADEKQCICLHPVRRWIVNPRCWLAWLMHWHLVWTSMPRYEWAIITICLVSLTDFPDLSAAHGALEWMEKCFHMSDTDGTVFAAIKASTSISKTSDDDDHPLYLNLRREKDVLASVWAKPPNQKALANVRLKQNSWSVCALEIAISSRHPVCWL